MSAVPDHPIVFGQTGTGPLHCTTCGGFLCLDGYPERTDGDWMHVRDYKAREAANAERTSIDAAVAHVAAACEISIEDAATVVQRALAEFGHADPDPEPSRFYPAGHGWTPRNNPFRHDTDDQTCAVMLARYPCNYPHDDHDPAREPELIDVFGYIRRQA